MVGLPRHVRARTDAAAVRHLDPAARAAQPARAALKLVAPNRFVLQWVKDRFGDRIAALAAEEATGARCRVEFAVAPEEAPAAPPAKPRGRPASAAAATPPCGSPPCLPRPGGARRRVPALRAPERQARTAPASTATFTFESFVSGKANQLARAAGLQVAEHPTSYNPLFVYGGVGLGKTHLIQAIGNHILQQNPAARDPLHPRRDLRVRRGARLPAQGFDEFKRHYRSLDLLLIDDIQFFGGKNRTQEEFFYLFNTLIEAHKQVVITCDTYPEGDRRASRSA